ncbi:MAG: VOC family protein [Candidatus Margulisiibacteriota bacterium]|nr:VOC family protein [Candidatus Margulisiibacteriota bacterium]
MGISPILKITSIDHIVLTVKDINKSLYFYETILGLKKEIFNQNRIALTFGNQKLNLHEYKHEIKPHELIPTPGSIDLCFLTESNISESIKYIQSNGINILEGPVQRTGANGPITSFYINDPDGNLIEIAQY